MININSNIISRPATASSGGVTHGASILMENSGYILLEDGSRINLE